mmetsp:Transcript_17674/g.29482  ORF Transcript_17674/g.29482 Transcript_17674/m.29482 type:complete len:220 (-) Transcript_17674:323-982(-)
MITRCHSSAFAIIPTLHFINTVVLIKIVPLITAMPYPDELHLPSRHLLSNLLHPGLPSHHTSCYLHATSMLPPCYHAFYRYLSGSAHHRSRSVLHPTASARFQDLSLAPLRLSPSLLQPESPLGHAQHLTLLLGRSLMRGEEAYCVHPSFLDHLARRLKLDCFIVRHNHPLKRHRHIRTQQATLGHKFDLPYHGERNHARLAWHVHLLLYTLPHKQRAI